MNRGGRELIEKQIGAGWPSKSFRRTGSPAQGESSFTQQRNQNCSVLIQVLLEHFCAEKYLMRFNQRQPRLPLIVLNEPKFLLAFSLHGPNLTLGPVE